MARQKYNPIPELTPEETIRFWSHVQKGKSDECWPWITPPKPGRYGCFGIKRDDKISIYISTRIMWRVTKGEDPGQVGIAHTCDNPPCMNPDHHFKATQQENIDDCINKGRWVGASFETRSAVRKAFFAAHPERKLKGERCGASKLRDEQVRQIRSLLASGQSHSQIAFAFHISPTTVHRIRVGETWAHI